MKKKIKKGVYYWKDEEIYEREDSLIPLVFLKRRRMILLFRRIFMQNGNDYRLGDYLVPFLYKTKEKT